MRLNKFLATHTDLSRRAADTAIANGRVTINGAVPPLGTPVNNGDMVALDGKPVTLKEIKKIILLLNKPVGYVCSRDGQGSRTVYDLLPEQYHSLKPVGRLDKDSTGLLLMTNDGELAHKLTHPSNRKEKVYLVAIDMPLSRNDQEYIGRGVPLDDGPSVLKLRSINPNFKEWEVRMNEGRNRQIRRTFSALDYRVTDLHRITFGEYQLETIPKNELYYVL